MCTTLILLHLVNLPLTTEKQGRRWRRGRRAAENRGKYTSAFTVDLFLVFKWLWAVSGEFHLPFISYHLSRTLNVLRPIKVPKDLSLRCMRYACTHPSDAQMKHFVFYCRAVRPSSRFSLGSTAFFFFFNPTHTHPQRLPNKSKVVQAVKRFGTAVQLSGWSVWVWMCCCCMRLCLQPPPWKD